MLPKSIAMAWLPALLLLANTLAAGNALPDTTSKSLAIPRLLPNANPDDWKDGLLLLPLAKPGEWQKHVVPLSK
ncbi:hypothetical protein ACTID9_07625 [Brevibacillus fluminis]|uniref:hypothetical protein n=1 Tax=Brevibacillus fluminis TaxID=511487 RepID=UPI003F8AD7FD